MQLEQSGHHNLGRLHLLHVHLEALGPYARRWSPPQYEGLSVHLDLLKFKTLSRTDYILGEHEVFCLLACIQGVKMTTKYIDVCNVQTTHDRMLLLYR